MRNIVVYISSPYTLGDAAVNVKRQMDMADMLMNLNFIPFAPLYFHFQQMMHPRSYDHWIEVDKIWVSRCDCVLRLSGISKGADIEVEKAIELGIPVFYNVDDLVDYYKNWI